MTIIDYLAEEKQKNLLLVSDFLDTQINRYQSLTPVYSELLNCLKSHLLRGGKWHRPALALLSYRLAGGKQVDQIRENVSALELFHRYLLIHDDIIDQDDTRHGGPTLEAIYRDVFGQHYGRSMAMVAGDVVCAMAYELLQNRISDPVLLQHLVGGCNQLLMETVAGWQLQTKQNYLAVDQVTEAEFLNGMKLVSAQYSVVWPMRIGQLFAGQIMWNQDLDTYGFHTGMAFQITDDILGMFGDEVKTGKPVGHDFREGKKTLLVLYAYQHGSDTDRAFIRSKLGTEVSPDDVTTARAIFTDTGSLDYSYRLAQNHVAQAKEILKSVISADREALGLLGQLADLFGKRDF